MATVQRYDAGEVRGIERTPQGGLRVAGAVARTGVLVYQTTDGRTVREYVSPEVLFAADSVASLRGAPITDLHPVDDAGKPVLVTAATWKKYSVGTLGDTARADGALLVADLLVQDAAEVALVEAQQRRELSCGYEAEIDATPGVSPAGEHYDQAQTSRLYNHVGLGPPGWGRAGPSVALRMDAAGHVLPAAPPPPVSSAVTHARLDAAKDSSPMKTVLKIAGREYTLRADALEGDAAAAQGAVDQTAMQLDQLEKALQDALGQVALYKAQCAAQKTAAAPAAPADGSPEEAMALDSKIARREALRADARAAGLSDDEAKALVGKPDVEIMRAVLAKALPETKLDGFSVDRLAGMFTATVAAAKRAAAAAAKDPKAADAGARNDGLAAAHQAAIGGAPAPRADADDEDPFTKMCRTLEASSRAPLGETAGKGA